MIAVVGGGYQPEPKPQKMKAKRRRLEPEFKARAALEAVNAWISMFSTLEVRFQRHKNGQSN